VAGDTTSLFSAAARFVVAAVRRFLEPGVVLPDPGEIDYRKILEFATSHAVLPMVYRSMWATGITPELEERLRPAFEESARDNLGLAAELRALHDLLTRGGVPFVPLKGPLLSQRLYGDLSIRSSGDLDLLVHREDLLRVRDLVAGLGYQVGSVLPWPSDAACFRSRECELLMVDKTRSLPLDLHWRLLPAYFPSPLDESQIWSSLISTRFAGRDLPDLCPEHLLLFLCVHACKHAFERLGWICDIASCMRTQVLEWKSVLAIAAQSGTTRQLLLGVRVTANLLGVPHPAELPQDSVVEPLAHLVTERVLGARPLPIPTRELIPFCLKTFESAGQRARYLAGHLSPSSAEYQAVHLPLALHFLYYPFRTLRLAARLARSRFPIEDSEN
jgi:Uncharacterised nucleotidyltransferase